MVGEAREMSKGWMALAGDERAGFAWDEVTLSTNGMLEGRDCGVD
jgi:hypothetical protein